MTTIDFGQLMKDAGDGFQPVPEGPYHVEVAKAEYKIAGTGKPMYSVQFRILSGPHAGRLVFNNFVIVADNPNALSFFFDHMEALGLPRTYFAANPAPEAVATAMVGRQALIAVKIRTEGQYAGRNDVSSVKPPPGGQIGGQPAGGNVLAFPGQPAPAAPVVPPVAPPQPPVPSAPVMPAVAQPPVPQPAPVAPVAPPQPVAPPMPVAPPVPSPEAYAPQPAVAPIPPAPVGVVPPPMPIAPPQPVPAAAPAPVQYEQPAPAPVPAAAPPVYNPADEEPY